MLNGITKNIK